MISVGRGWIETVVVEHYADLVQPLHSLRALPLIIYYVQEDPESEYIAKYEEVRLYSTHRWKIMG